MRNLLFSSHPLAFRLRIFAAATAGLLAVACFGQSRPPSSPLIMPDDSLRGFLQRYLRRPSSTDDKTARYQNAWVDLSGGGKKEAIVYIVSQRWCGSGGCITLVLTPEGASYRVVTKIRITRPPIRVLATSSHGWHDIGVWVQGGGIQPGYEAKLQFDGKTYPSNPSIPPALPEAGKVEGKVVIAPLQEGVLLYP
jgi:hypothetical protein